MGQLLTYHEWAEQAGYKRNDNWTRLPDVLSLLAFVIFLADGLAGIVVVIWIIVEGFKWIYRLLEPSYEDDDEEDDNCEK